MFASSASVESMLLGSNARAANSMLTKTLEMCRIETEILPNGKNNTVFAAIG